MSILADILSTGYVEKDLLDALDDEQKQLLFCQMRAEQVRKWEEFEERMDKEGPAKRDMNKRRIEWLTGQDGDVWVWVMGDHPTDPTIEQILDEEARQEAHIRALRELSQSTEDASRIGIRDLPPEEALKAQLGSLRLGVSDTMYDEADLYNSDHPLLFQPAKSSTGPVSLRNGDAPPAPVRATTVSSYTVPQPKMAEVRGPVPPPPPQRPPLLPKPVSLQSSNTAFGSGAMPSSQWDDSITSNGVKMRPAKAVEDNAPDVVAKRESEIFQSIQDNRDRLRKEAEAEAERQRKEWEVQNNRARAAEAAMREMAQKARAKHQQLIRTSESILPALRDKNATSLREAIKNLPRPPKPKSRAAIIEWFKKDELPRGTGLDPKTKAPAPWFHGIISRDQAEDLLVGKPTGSFLVRVSERIWGYTVSYVVSNGSCKHFLVERPQEGYQFLGTNQVVHQQLFDLVSYHETAPITAKGGEILKWAVGQVTRPPDYSDLMPNMAPTRFTGRF